MNTLTNENFEKLPTEAQEQRLSGSHNNKLEPTAKTSGAMAEEPKPEFDVRDIFTPLDDGEWSPALGRPDDYPGFESLSVLLTGRSYRAGKSYRPDSSGLRRASKVDDYSLGTDFLCNTVWFES